MGPYRDSNAARYVGQIIRTHLSQLHLSAEDFALRLGLKSVAKAVSFMKGQHYFPLEKAKPTARLLNINEGELVYFILLQYFPKEAVDHSFEAIGAYTLSRLEPAEEEKRDEVGKKKKKKKKKKSRKRG